MTRRNRRWSLGHLIYRLRVPSIRSRAVQFFLITLLPVLLTTTTMTLNSQGLLSVANQLFSSNVFFDSMEHTLDEATTALGDYLSTNNSDSLKLYLQNSAEIRRMGQAIPMSNATPPEVETADSRSQKGQSTRILRKNIQALTSQYLIQGDAAVAARRGRFVERYIAHYREAELINSFISKTIQELNQNELAQNILQYQLFSSLFSKIQLLGTILTLLSAFFALFLLTYSTYQISEPIMNLADGADEIAAGNFELPDFNPRGFDEVIRLATAYNTMKASILDYIAQIKEKGEIEKGLMEQRLANLRMQHLLKSAEIQALQAQINPHFLFNTLNTGVQLAIVEGAERTSSYLEHLSEVYRHNVRHINRASTLKEELEVLDSYIYVVQIRFADRFSFRHAVDPDCRGVGIPSMILQPLVENALVHGLKERETGGVIEIKARKVMADFNREDVWHPGPLDYHADPEILPDARSLLSTAVLIEVRDNGRGMDVPSMEEALNEDLIDYSFSGETPEGRNPGIGIRNVIHRIHLFFGRRGLVTIESQPGQGTAVKMVLPYEEQIDE